MKKEIRTRFAPSPTGFQHIGGMRTAFYAWLLAKSNNGKFILRIEDTDQERRVPGAVRFIIEELAWFGIMPDEGPAPSELEMIGESYQGMPEFSGQHGPYVQSLRLERYQEVAEELVRKGFAYRCDCTPEMLEKERAEQMARREVPGYSGFCRTRQVGADSSHVIRFKMPHKPSLSIDDAVKGRVAWESVPLKDPVLFKSGKFPTYHLAALVDDHDMRVSHVMRGDEWLPSTPLHLLIYQALGWEPPIFAHLPVVLGTDGKKLSKRSGAASSSDLRELGFLPEALLNYVVLVGWSPGEGEEQEIFTRDELINKFSLSGVNRSSGVFDIAKLSWMNGAYIRKLSDQEFDKAALPFLVAGGAYDDNNSEHKIRWQAIAPHVRERIKTLKEVPEMTDFLFKEQISRELDAMISKKMDQALAVKVLTEVQNRLKLVENFTPEAIEPALNEAASFLELKTGPVFIALRIATTGKKATPPLFESLAALGKELSLQRIAEAIGELHNLTSGQ
jgi:glutamyl-tRNA synthetase